MFLCKKTLISFVQKLIISFTAASLSQLYNLQCKFYINTFHGRLTALQDVIIEDSLQNLFTMHKKSTIPIRVKPNKSWAPSPKAIGESGRPYWGNTGCDSYGSYLPAIFYLKHFWISFSKNKNECYASVII
uniref:Uncharacterized protein n=1 Tax=Chlamydomonas leiostraca TaxID=1034604 RepID=A0A1L2M5A6_9CHLO|nr:hypothetical protein [Chlamydomonas leiostraca]APD80646.1 hypothetical protein [Chlamydomonas leiostraca]